MLEVTNKNEYIYYTSVPSNGNMSIHIIITE